MKVLLIDPRFYRWGFSAPYSVASYGLICVATYLNQVGHKAEIVDMNGGERGIEWEELPTIIREKAPDIVGVPSAMTCYVPESLRAVEIAKSIDPNIITIGGGINFTINSRNLMEQNPELDFIVRGDGEYTTEELLRALESGDGDFSQIKGLAWRRNGEIVLNPDRPPITDLDSLPLPDWDLVDLDHYGVNTFPPSWGKQVLLTLSRGCPYRCKFCAPTLAAQNTFREHSAERKVEMLKVLVQKYDRKMFWVNDLIFGVNEEKFKAFLEGIVEEGLDINMCIDMRVDEALQRKELFPLMRRAGVRIVCMGFESPLEEDIEKYKKYKKEFNPYEASKEVVSLLRKNRINTWGFFMIGELDHTPEKVGKIWRFADEVDTDLTIFPMVNPHPGTPYYEEVKEHLATHDLAHFDENTPVFHYPFMTDNQMRMLYPQAWVSYYLKPSRVLRKYLFGDEYNKWFYGFMRSNANNWGVESRRTWERLGWQGFGSKKEEKRLKIWAQKTLGLRHPTRAVVSALERMDMFLRKVHLLKLPSPPP